MEMRAAAGEASPGRQQQQLPPGFRFHPTDVELVLQYLRRKALERPLPAAVIPVLHSAAMPDPWDLPGASEGEPAYFFRLRQAAASGPAGRRRRAAGGYWKATGKEKQVFVQLPGNGKQLLVGVKTALAFHGGNGKATPARTDWVMHEYRLAGFAEQNKRASANDESQSCTAQASSQWVVCRVSLKNRAAARRPAGSSETTTAAVVRQEDAGAHHQLPSASPSSSSCVTDHASNAPDQEEVSSGGAGASSHQQQQQPRR